MASRSLIKSTVWWIYLFSVKADEQRTRDDSIIGRNRIMFWRHDCAGYREIICYGAEEDIQEVGGSCEGGCQNFLWFSSPFNRNNSQDTWKVKVRIGFPPLREGFVKWPTLHLLLSLSLRLSSLRGAWRMNIGLPSTAGEVERWKSWVGLMEEKSEYLTTESVTFFMSS